MLQHIAPALSTSLYESTVSDMLVAVVCTARSFPHVLLVVHTRPKELRSALVICERLPGVLTPHHTPYSRGACPHLER